jgi:DNA polymerase III epsilon subunit-like protein
MIAADKLWIMVDVETSGPIIGRHSMTELGAVVGSRARGLLDRFEVLITPISDLQKTSRASFERARLAGLPPAEAMGKFAAWCQPHQARRATFIARPAAFDWPWIVQYAWAHLGENPFGFKAVCASSWFEGQGRTFQVDLPHRAVDDAELQLRHFFEHG